MQRKKILKFLNFWLPPIAWAIMIFKFSSGKVPMATESYWLDFVIKKIGHAILYAVMSVLLYRGLTGSGVQRRKAAIWAFFLAFFYGASDEFHQMYTQGREARIRDVMIDGFGAGLAVIFLYRYLSLIPAKLRGILKNIGID